ncbi:MAG: hypothetical protein AB7N76_21375 [Planctomycetota bacterium]
MTTVGPEPADRWAWAKALGEVNSVDFVAAAAARFAELRDDPAAPANLRVDAQRERALRLAWHQRPDGLSELDVAIAADPERAEQLLLWKLQLLVALERWADARALGVALGARAAKLDPHEQELLARLRKLAADR